MWEGKLYGLIYGKITQVIFYCRIFSILGVNIFHSFLFSDILNYSIDVGISRNQGCKYFQLLNNKHCCLLGRDCHWNFSLT